MRNENRISHEFLWYMIFVQQVVFSSPSLSEVIESTVIPLQIMIDSFNRLIYRVFVQPQFFL